MLFIDNTYISSLEELKVIIESHAKENSNRSANDFRIELVEAFEDKTDSGLQFFVESLNTDEAREYVTKLKELDTRWDNLSFIDKFNELLLIFNCDIPVKIDLINYFTTDIREEDTTIVIDIKVIHPINENIQLDIVYYDANNKVFSREQTEKQLLYHNANHRIHIEKKKREDDTITKYEIWYANHKIFDSEVYLMEKEREDFDNAVTIEKCYYFLDRYPQSKKIPIIELRLKMLKGMGLIADFGVFARFYNITKDLSFTKDMFLWTFLIMDSIGKESWNNYLSVMRKYVNSGYDPDDALNKLDARIKSGMPIEEVHSSFISDPVYYELLKIFPDKQISIIRDNI